MGQTQVWVHQFLVLHGFQSQLAKVWFQVVPLQDVSGSWWFGAKYYRESSQMRSPFQFYTFHFFCITVSASAAALAPTCTLKAVGYWFFSSLQMLCLPKCKWDHLSSKGCCFVSVIINKMLHLKEVGMVSLFRFTWYDLSCKLEFLPRGTTW